jgi:hypothetical protein
MQSQRAQGPCRRRRRPVDLGFVTILLTPTEVTDPDAVMIDIEGHGHRFQALTTDGRL